ncbi:trypsin epsilon [Drosophila eugracilis]|uniref:trypsin epsilon n=1 Tax=Drosophila eugracilis TaxID=29029 RepID=UPI0007E85D31|nr:trypsin epsilon [Drosophila eugracilis]
MLLASCIVLIFFLRSTPGIQLAVDASFKFWKFIASLWVNGYQECGGSVIDDHVVLTAAQCVKGIPAKNITVRVGTPSINRGGEIIQVTATVVHPNYKEWDNDIALLWLESSALSDRVSKIEITNSEPNEGEYPSNAGWGETGLEVYVMPKLLQKGVTKVKNRENCSEELIEPFGKEILCTHYKDNDICPGDYGGPLVLANKLVGIAVQGHGCGHVNLPSLYVNVFHYRKWIDQNLKKLKKNKK